MGNNAEGEKAGAELYVVQQKMSKTMKRIQEFLQPMDEDELPFHTQKKRMKDTIEKCENKVKELRKGYPSLTENWGQFIKDFKKMNELLEKVKFRSDLSDEKAINELYPVPVLSENFDQKLLQQIEDVKDIVRKNIEHLNETKSPLFRDEDKDYAKFLKDREETDGEDNRFRIDSTSPSPQSDDEEFNISLHSEPSISSNSDSGEQPPPSSQESESEQRKEEQENEKKE